MHNGRNDMRSSLTVDACARQPLSDHRTTPSRLLRRCSFRTQFSSDGSLSLVLLWTKAPFHRFSTLVKRSVLALYKLLTQMIASRLLISAGGHSSPICAGVGAHSVTISHRVESINRLPRARVCSQHPSDFLSICWSTNLYLFL